MNYFDQAAQQWDENPVHFERSKAIATKILEQGLLDGKNTALEFGAGTGILSVMLSNSLRHITLMDSSAEMIKIMAKKIDNLQLNQLEAIHFDLEKDNLNNRHFDAILTQMAMHHVKDVVSVFKKFYKLLNPGGVLIIADLYPEDGSFHGSEFDVHKGFDPENWANLLSELGFSNIKYESCYVINRLVYPEITKSFPVFLLSATKIL